ncbi:MAG: fused MFS/spermidine synthase, partial [Planctomycetota bacterium]
MSRQSFAIAFIAFQAGFSVMVVELSAVRVLAPSFGDSVPVWTNVIGVILLALAIGAFVGGWVADRDGSPRLLPWLLLAAGGLLLVVPGLAPWLARWIMPEALALDRAMAVLVEGSLAVTLLVFAPPVLLLGTISPLLIRIGASGRAARTGRVSGLVYATGTLGSLLGTFLATHLLVPYLGLRTTFFVAAAALISAGLIAGWLGARLRARALAALLPCGLCLLIGEPRPVWLGAQQRLLARADSYYQRLWVVEDHEELEGQRRRVRSLKINEGLDSFHSVWIQDTPFTNGRYYDSFSLLPAMLAESRGEEGRRAVGESVRALSLGCGAGSILRILRWLLGSRLDAVGVELDPSVLELGRRYFALPQSAPGFRLLGHLGARVYVSYVDKDGPPFDLICLDTYRNQIYLPEHLASVEFFRALRGRLAVDGILALNLNDFSDDGAVISAVAGTLAAVFPSVESFRSGRNFFVFAHAGKPGLLHRSLGRAPVLARSLPKGLVERARRDGASRPWQALPEAELLRDGRSRLGALHDRIYRRTEPADRP